MAGYSRISATTSWTRHHMRSGNAGRPNRCCAATNSASIWPGRCSSRRCTIRPLNVFLGILRRCPGTHLAIVLRTVPTSRAIPGNFSGTVDSAGQPLPIYDPASTRPNPAFDASQPVTTENLQYLRDPFPGNMIPASRLDPSRRSARVITQAECAVGTLLPKQLLRRQSGDEYGERNDRQGGPQRSLTNIV